MATTDGRQEDRLQQTAAALSLLQRLPPKDLQVNLAGLQKAAPHLEKSLAPYINRPLQIGYDPEHHRYFVQCDYNCEGARHRSPWSNKYLPQTQVADAEEEPLAKPSERLRSMEEVWNDVFDAYKTAYYDGGVSSVYLWDLDEGFAGAFLIRKELHQSHDILQAVWDSVHVLEVTEPQNKSGTEYKLSSSVLLHMQMGDKGKEETEMSGIITRQAELKSSRPKKTAEDLLMHCGHMIEQNEIFMRQSLDNLYMAKQREILAAVRRLEPLDPERPVVTERELQRDRQTLEEEAAETERQARAAMERQQHEEAERKREAAKQRAKEQKEQEERLEKEKQLAKEKAEREREQELKAKQDAEKKAADEKVKKEQADEAEKKRRERAEELNAKEERERERLAKEEAEVAAAQRAQEEAAQAAQRAQEEAAAAQRAQEEAAAAQRAQEEAAAAQRAQEEAAQATQRAQEEAAQSAQRAQEEAAAAQRAQEEAAAAQRAQEEAAQAASEKAKVEAARKPAEQAPVPAQEQEEEDGEEPLSPEVPISPTSESGLSESPDWSRRRSTKAAKDNAVFPKFDPKLREFIANSCFEHDWSLLKSNEWIPQEQAEHDALAEKIRVSYLWLLGLYRKLSSQNIGQGSVADNVSVFGVTQRSAINLLDSDAHDGIDLFDKSFTKANAETIYKGVLSASVNKDDKKKKEFVCHADSRLVRFKFVEFLILVAKDKYAGKSLSAAADSLLEALSGICERYSGDVKNLFQTASDDRVEATYKKLRDKMVRTYGANATAITQEGLYFMSLSDWTRLLKQSNVHISTSAKLDDWPYYYRLGLETEADEQYSFDFQRMSFREFERGVGAVLFLGELRAKKACPPERLSESLEVFADTVNRLLPNNSRPKGNILKSKQQLKQPHIHRRGHRTNTIQAEPVPEGA